MTRLVLGHSGVSCNPTESAINDGGHAARGQTPESWKAEWNFKRLAPNQQKLIRALVSKVFATAKRARLKVIPGGCLNNRYSRQTYPASFIVSRSGKTRMSQVTLRGPLGKLGN